MAQKNKILHDVLFVGLVGVLAGGTAFGAVRIGNRTKNDVYREMVAANAAAMQSGVVDASARVTNEDVAKQSVIETDGVGAPKMEMCSRIYPNGDFTWARPTAGIGAGGASTCVAVVELRMIGSNNASVSNPNKEYTVLARANVAAGTSVKCNISDFPESSYTIDAQNVIFPADNEPTTADVIKVMDQEQKQNAALKIAAGALIGGIGGNIAGKNDVGKDGLIGTDKGKMQGTVIGALSGAAIGAGGSYFGKVGGDMVLSTGVNAAAGGVVGNIMASGDSVLRIEDCKNDDGASAKCLWGYVVKGDRIKESDGVYYNINESTVVSCKDGMCSPDNIASIKIKFDGKDREINSLNDTELRQLGNGAGIEPYHLESQGNGKSEMKSGFGNGITFVRVVDAIRTKSRQPALVWGIQDKFFGMKRSDLYTWKSSNSGAKIYTRNTSGNAEKDLTADGYTLNDFEPIYVDASDGGIIDLDNKSRLKGTMIGAGVGGAAGAFTAYQGAQSDIEERWVSAVREYKDSLQKFYCATGTRFLSYYNDTVVIPNMGE